DHYIDAAARLLEPFPPDKELGWTYNYRAMFAMLAEEADAQEWGDRAFALAERLGDDELVIHAFHTCAMARLYAGDATGREQVDEGLRRAMTHGFEADAGRAWSNLSCYLVRYRQYTDAYDCIAAGVAYCVDRDLDLYTYQMMSWRALAAFEQGNWES